MKKILISEGLNDGMFIETILSTFNFSKNEYKIFLQDDVPMHKKRHAETNVLRSFMKKTLYNPHKFLVKLEGGKDSAIKIFCRELANLTRVDECILMLDIDVGTPEKRIDALKKIIEDSYASRQNTLKLTYEKKAEHDPLYHFSFTMSKGNTEIGKFQVILFRVSLEASCSIEDRDSKETKLEKIKNFVKNEKIQNFFDPIIN